MFSHRIREEPFDPAATLILFAAIVHTFLSSRFVAVSHRWEHEHGRAKAEGPHRIPATPEDLDRYLRNGHAAIATSVTRAIDLARTESCGQHIVANKT